jgi:hypothetical protein
VEEGFEECAEGLTDGLDILMSTFFGRGGLGGDSALGKVPNGLLEDVVRCERERK